MSEKVTCATPRPDSLYIPPVHTRLSSSTGACIPAGHRCPGLFPGRRLLFMPMISPAVPSPDACRGVSNTPPPRNESDHRHVFSSALQIGAAVPTAFGSVAVFVNEQMHRAAMARLASEPSLSSAHRGCTAVLVMAVYKPVLMGGNHQRLRTKDSKEPHVTCIFLVTQ